MSFIRAWIANIIGLWLANYLVGGFGVTNSILGLIIAGAILGILFVLVQPLLKTIAAPAVWVTMGLFLIIINGFIIWLVAEFTSYVSFSSFTALLWATLVISAINFIFKGFKA